MIKVNRTSCTLGLVSIGLCVAVAVWVQMRSGEQPPEVGALTVAEHFEFDQMVGDEADQEAVFQRMLADGVGMLDDRLRVAGDPQINGAWEPAFELPLIPIHSTLLADGRVMGFGLFNHNGNTLSPVAIWDPTTGETSRADLSTGGGGYLFCSGMSKMSDGRLFVAGGTVGSNVPIRKTNIFDSFSETWEWGPTMAAGRWYDAVTPLANGEMLITGGGPSTPEVRQLNGTLRRLTGASNSVTGNISQHPWIQQSPRGGAVYLGPRQGIYQMDTAGAGGLQFLTNKPGGSRNYGNSVLYEQGKVLLVSGNSANTAEVVTLDSAVPTIEVISGPAKRRYQGNSTILADGKVLVTGGNTSGQLYNETTSVYEAELWDPSTRQFSSLASMQFTRQYHSTTLLLPDGRVISAGGQQGSTYALRNAELFLPPYLFDKHGSGELADRPSILSAPSTVNYGQSIELAVQTDLPIAKLTLIRPGSGTHSTNMEQRAVAAPSVDLGNGRVRWTTPAGGHLAPPGFYMLFAVDTDGVPSVGRMVQIGANIGNSFDDLEFANPGFQVSSDQQDVALQVLAHSSANLNIQYSSDSLPNGLEINSSTGLISGTPFLSGTFTTIIDSTDGAGRFKSVTFQWQVIAEPPTGEPLADGLAGYWPIYDSSAVESDTHDAVDVIGSADGIAVENAAYVNDEGRGRVLTLDGNGDHLRLPIDVSETSASYSFWFKTDTANQPLFSTSTDVIGSNTDRRLFLEANGISATLSGQTISGGQNYADNTWHHVMFSHGSSGQMLYVDGELIAEGSRVSSSQSGQTIVLVGSDPVRSGTQFSGLIDDIRYYDAQIESGAAFLLFSNSANTPPTLAGVADRNNEVGQSVSLQLQGSDAEGQALQYSAQSLPVGLQLNSNSGLVTGSLSAAGSSTVTFSVRDSAGASSQDQSMQWIVTEPVVVNQRPVMADLVAQVHTTGQSVSVGFSANDPDGDVLQYGASGLPTGMSIESLSGVVSGVPSQVGRFNVSVSATDPSGLSVSKAFTWSIEQNTDILGQPVLTSSFPPAAVKQGVAAQYVASASSQSGVQYRWAFGDGSTDTAWSSSGSVNHAFDVAGRYVVTVFAKNASGDQTSLQFSQNVHAELTQAKPLSSTGLVLDESRARVWVANPDNDTVTLLNTNTQQVLREISVGEQPVSLALASDGSVWVSNKGSATISIIDTGSLEVARTLELPQGSQPHGLLVTSDKAYVALESVGQVLALRLSDGQVLQTAEVASRVRGLALDASRAQLMVSRFISPVVAGESTANVDLNSGGGELYVLSAETLALRRVVKLPVSFVGDSDVSGNGLPNYLAAPVISPDGLTVWVPSKQDNIGRGTLRNTFSLNHQNSVRAVASQIRLSDWGHTWQDRVDFDNSSVATAAAFDANGNYLLVALETSAELAIIDAHDKGILARVSVGRAPSAVAVSQDGSKVWVHNFVDRSLSIIDTNAFFAGASEQLLVSGTINLVSDEKLSAQVLLGKQLFHDASDDRLALENYISCASCHNDGDHDGRVWDFTQFGEGLRNTTSLRGKGAVAHGALHWTGNFDEFHDFEGQIRGFAAGTGLMTQDDFDQTREPLGAPKTGRSVDLDALAAYMASLNTMPASPLSGEGFSVAATQGKVHFESAGCATCHSGAAMTDSAAARRHDVGTISASSGNRLGGNLDGFDTPTLLNLHETGPYLHDGSATTVRDAIAAHSSASSLSASELGDLQSYLLELPATGDTAALLRPIVSGDSHSASVGADDWHYYVIDVDADISELVVELSGLSADADLYVRANEVPSGHVGENGEYDGSSTHGGASNERVSLTNTGETSWYIGVHGYRSSDYTLSVQTIKEDTSTETLTLLSGELKSGSLAQGKWQYFKIATEGDTDKVLIELSGLSADGDLYVRRGAKPTGHNGNGGVYDCQSILGGSSSERCTVESSAVEDWYIGVYGYRSTSFTIKATLLKDGTTGGSNDNRPLVVDQVVSDSLLAGEWHYYSISLPADALVATTRLSGLSDDLDLYVRRDERPSGSVSEGGTYDCGSYQGGVSSEQCVNSNVADADLLIGVHAYRAGSYQLVVETQSSATTVVTPIASNDPASASVSQGEWRYYRYVSAQSDQRVEVVLDQLQADVDVYVRQGELPLGDPAAGANADCVSLLGGTSTENCVVANTSVNEWFIGVYGYQSSSFRLQVNGFATRALTATKPLSQGKDTVLKEAADLTSSSSGKVTTGGGGTGGLFLILFLVLTRWGRRYASSV